jgi:hypothetical protein
LVDATIAAITSTFKLPNNKIFLIRPITNSSELILSYNVLLDGYKQFLHGSILVHRKKETNTIYTINALNELIQTINNGVLDKSYKIDWELYTDTILLKKPDGLKNIKIELVKMYSF